MKLVGDDSVVFNEKSEEYFGGFPITLKIDGGLTDDFQQTIAAATIGRTTFLHIFNYVQAVQYGAVFKIILAVSTRSGNSVATFGELEQVAIDCSACPFLTAPKYKKR